MLGADGAGSREGSPSDFGIGTHGATQCGAPYVECRVKGRTEKGAKAAPENEGDKLKARKKRQR